MARQDIYGCISDDILNDDRCTSSARGKVHHITTWINTDVVGDGTCHYVFDKEHQTVEVRCEFPKSWNVSINKKNE